MVSLSHTARTDSLVSEHYESLSRFARSLTRCSPDAADLVQQTFLLWQQKGGQLRDPAKAKTWLFTTLYREFLGERRRVSRIDSLDALSDCAPEPAAPRSDFESRLDTAAVMIALQQIDQEYRVPLELFYLEHRSYKQIATATRSPIGTVMTRLHRGKQRLRRVLTSTEVATWSS